jgi:hypothetical protein
MTVLRSKYSVNDKQKIWSLVTGARWRMLRQIVERARDICVLTHSQ